MASPGHVHLILVEDLLQGISEVLCHIDVALEVVSVYRRGVDGAMDSHNDPGCTGTVNVLQGFDNPDPLGGASPKWLLSGQLEEGDRTVLKGVPLLVE